ncbi:hypothetical protein GALMADRAFT_1242928 [Galerina marginata CBS 339.88]|uniref:Uncharacterized protein n=1 Tax=Galerina marginata (strain CBS 339.88) TaxID=685588 RepID=A0A067T8J1_GALM3|nr:hypothetical protein GALMADRAFT_1242928 [Galerina marginata CBS 339.88]
MADYQSRSRTQSIARPADAQFMPQTSHYSHHSVADDTASWVFNAQQNPPSLPPPEPTAFRTPLKGPRPLPNPYAPPHPGHAQGALHVVNTTEPLESSAASSQDYSVGAARPRRKKSFVGGLVKGIRKLPNAMFGRSSKNRLKRQVTLETVEGTSSSVTGMTTGNTLPLYTSNPATPTTGPGPSGLHVSYRPAEPTILESPPPRVVRLSDTQPQVQQKRPFSFRVPPPPSDSIEPEENSQLFSQDRPRFNEHLSSEGSISSNPAERTTVMVYDRESRYYDQNQQEPTMSQPVPQQVSSPGLSYVSEHLTLAPVRPASFHSMHAQAPPPIEIPQRAPTPAAAPRVSYAPQAPPQRATPQSLIPGAFPAPSPPPPDLPVQQADIHPPPPHIDAPPVEAVDSPVTAHPGPTADYLKMTLSPQPTSHNTVTTRTRTSYFRDPSFTSDLSPVERFFKMLYHMPWISHDRVTVDYLPGEGLGKMKKRKFRPMSSWYKSMMSRSRRSSATLDLLSNGTGTQASSLGASLALDFGSPLLGSRSQRSAEKKRTGHHKSHHHSSSRHHHHHHNSHQRRRHTTTTMDTTDSEAQKYGEKRSISPLLPAVYPFQYPSYPYQAFPSFPMPAPPVAPFPPQGQAPHNQARERPVSPRGPRGEQQQQQQPMMYAPAGYGAYQSMMAAPQVYVLHAAPGPSAHMNPPIPPALIPGAGHSEQSHDLQVATRDQKLPGSF